MAEDVKLAPGDVVLLRSGGPPMTVVEAADGFGEVRVVWCLDGEIRKWTFRERTLRLLHPRPG